MSAVNAWNLKLASTGTSIRIKSNSESAATIGPDFAYYGETGWSGRGRPGPDPYSGNYTYADLQLNRTYLDGMNEEEPIEVITHELGHVLGLAHTVSSSNKSIMYQGAYQTWTITTPQTYDYNSLNSIY